MSITTKLSKAKRCPKTGKEESTLQSYLSWLIYVKITAKIYMIYEKMKVLKEGNNSKNKRSHTGA